MILLSSFDKTIQQIVAYKKLQTMLGKFDRNKEFIVYDTTIPVGDIVFDQVDFSYVNEKQILHDVSFVIPQGKKIALVGHTGAGKSTIAHLLLRFREVTNGSISWGGKNITDIGLGTLRQHIGVIMQDTTLFNTSIYNNLVRCIPPSWEDVSKKRRDERLKEIIHQAQADFVFDLPQGRETIIGERGLKLSGGEKQRIALARLLLKNPEIVILDEATSALDNQTEFQIKQVIDDVFVDTTMLIIAHRLSTVQQADWIIVLDQGTIVEQGTYDELMLLQGALWSLAHPEDVVIG